MLRKILSEPLLHFFFFGVCIFLVFEWQYPKSQTESRHELHITQEALLTFMQTRDQLFDDQLSKQKFSAMSDDQRVLLVDQAREQEVLYREAKKLGLDNNDTFIRRRLVQTMEYLLQTLAIVDGPPNRSAVAKYYQENLGNYQKPATITFKHKFYSADREDWKGAEIRAEKALLNPAIQDSVNLSNQADHFPYYSHYINKTASEISRHFGAQFAREIFSLSANGDRWQGTLRSGYGFHTLLIQEKTPVYVPALDLVYFQVQTDTQRNQLQVALRSETETLSEQYTITVEPFPTTNKASQ